ncbi:MAG: hypothetical protein HFI22_03305 [Lachnospiraceae bacterium]|uniref:VanZ family protein n=1 Tax=Candidatus Merdisoma sp. JLR.KK011 TaxID=3114299 RepID=UPI002FF17337|nr:hypothetical protein [Lachnospiraceae bacterium]
MSDYVMSTGSYLLIGLLVYLVFRAVIWLLYYKGEMRVPILHEAGFVLLAFLFLALFASSVSPALGFSLKPDWKTISLIPVKGSIDLVKTQGIGALFGAVLKFIPFGFLIPVLFRRYQQFFKVLFLCGGVSLCIEVFQIFLTGATASLDEFLLSLAGIFLGYFLFGIVRIYFREIERMGTVKRSRRRDVPFVVKKELEFLVILLLVAVVGKGTGIEVQRVKEEKAAQAELEKKQEEERKAAKEAEAARIAEEEAKKLKVSEQMPDLSLEAGAACLFSLDDDMILYEKNGTERVVPASTTKLLTALTVLKYCGTDEVLTAGEEISLISQGASTASLKVGMRGSVRTFLGAMLIPSGNDAAYSLANYTGHKILGNENASTEEAVEAFMGAMNECAAELELEDSNFVRPDGDQAENQYTTARDMVRIAKACMENETIMEIVKGKSFRALFENADITYQNSNQLVRPGDTYYYEGAVGLKTGSLDETKCLVGALEAGGRRYVAAVMQDTDEGRYKDIKILFDEVTGGGGEAPEPEPEGEEEE